MRNHFIGERRDILGGKAPIQQDILTKRFLWKLDFRKVKHTRTIFWMIFVKPTVDDIFDCTYRYVGSVFVGPWTGTVRTRTPQSLLLWKLIGSNPFRISSRRWIRELPICNERLRQDPITSFRGKYGVFGAHLQPTLWKATQRCIWTQRELRDAAHRPDVFCSLNLFQVDFTQFRQPRWIS